MRALSFIVDFVLLWLIGALVYKASGSIGYTVALDALVIIFGVWAFWQGMKDGRERYRPNCGARIKEVGE